MEKSILLNFFKSQASVVSFKEILLATPSITPSLLKRRLHYYVQKKELYAIRRGLYAKDKHYNKRELATKIFTPAYISFETVLIEAGIIFQYYSTIFVATYQTKEIICDGQSYSFKKIKSTILTNTTGIENKGNYFTASPERAFLDILYLNKNYHFDNLAPLNFDKVFSILPIYNNKRMEKVVRAHFKSFQDDELPIITASCKTKHIDDICRKCLTQLQNCSECNNQYFSQNVRRNFNEVEKLKMGK